jgi:hypothetical protein
MRRLVVLLGLMLLLLGVGQARDLSVGVSVAPLTPVGAGIGVQVAWNPLTLEVPWSQPTRLLLRADATLPVSFDLYPSTNLVVGVSVREGPLDLYAAAGAGLWFSRVNDEPCWDFTAVVLAGVDWFVAERVAVRVEAQSAPFLGALQVHLGVAYSFMLD